jgi:hypothetical protein
MSGRVLVVDEARSATRVAAAAGDAAPAGFRRDANGAGLIVPEALSRIREVITKDEWKALDRAIRKVLGPREIAFRLECRHHGCPEPRIQRLPADDGGFVLRCGHADRVFTPEI